MKFWKIILAFFFLLLTLVWLAAWQTNRNFHIIACSVGEGDATLLTYGDTQILVDGGPNNKVLDCLSRHMPFWDRKIEMVILTHPQSDHLAGLIEVFRRYRVEQYLENDLNVSTTEYQVLKKLVGGQKVKVINPTSGMVIGNSKIYLDILTDLVDEKQTSSSNVNEKSIIVLVKYGDFEALLTGDYEFNNDKDLLSQIAEIVPENGVEYIKVPHHGSKNGLTRALLEITKPQLAVISVGKNQWGHPNQETLSLLENFNVKFLRTDEKGDIETVSDGKNWWTKKIAY